MHTQQQQQPASIVEVGLPTPPFVTQQDSSVVVAVPNDPPNGLVNGSRCLLFVPLLRREGLQEGTDTETGECVTDTCKQMCNNFRAELLVKVFVPKLLLN